MIAKVLEGTSVWWVGDKGIPCLLYLACWWVEWVISEMEEYRLFHFFLLLNRIGVWSSVLRGAVNGAFENWKDFI